MKYSEINTMDSHVIKTKIVEYIKQLWGLKLKKSIASSTIKDTSVFKKARRTLAKLKFKLSTLQ